MGYGPRLTSIFKHIWSDPGQSVLMGRIGAFGGALWSSQAATQPAASEPGPNTPLPAKRSKCTEAEQAAEPTQPTKSTGKGKAAKAKRTPQPGR
ncbi:hypothetical protein QJQ45_003500 [Haematococcus lacustris]|nr:hypothetical protein QJQ45_003500 [Haematococcus lacustris]